MDQVATLTTGWEPDTPLDDSVLRPFVFAYADRVAWMAQATPDGMLLVGHPQLGFLDLVRLTIWEHQPAKP